MRKLFLLGVAALALAVFGCSSNSGSDITGPVGATASGSTPAPQLPPVPEPIAAPGFYGTVSNLGASGFTLTSPDGRTLNVTTTPETNVLYQGTMTNLADSPLADGMNVSVNGAVSGQPQQARIRAGLVVINSSLTNRGLIVAE